MNYDQKELQIGTAIEHEHTGDDRLAQKIAMDHLIEDPKYYSKLNAAGLEQESVSGCGVADVAIIKIGGNGVGQIPKSGEATPAKPLTSSNLGSGTPKPLVSTGLKAPSKNIIPGLGKTPPKTGGKDSAMGDLNVKGSPISDEEGNAKPNNIEYGKTPTIAGSNSNSDATDFFGDQISKALKPDVPRRMELIPANISEGGAQLKKKVDNFGGVKVDAGRAGLTTDMTQDRRWTIDAFDTKTANKKETPKLKELSDLWRSQNESGKINLKELIFQNNAGVMEVFKFFENASDEEKNTFDSLVNDGKQQEAWSFLERVLNVKLQGDGPWSP